MSANHAIPLFYLYGEPHRSVEDGFVHVESLDDRTRPSEWTIRQHSHAELNHVFHVAAGGGALQAEDRRLDFVAPCLLVIPAGIAHGFSWQTESVGSVVTLASTHLRQLAERDPDLDGLFRRVAVVPLPETQDGAIHRRIAQLMREQSWARRGHRAAIDAGLLDLMVLALRHIDAGIIPEGPSPGAQARTVALLRERIETRFRLREPVAAYASALGVSLFQLRSACARIAGTSPLEMIDQRAMLEARRALLYSNLSVGEIAYSLGFSDAAYFSRFFKRRAGCAPRDYRSRRNEA